MMDTQKSASVIPQCEPPVIKWETVSFNCSSLILLLYIDAEQGRAGVDFGEEGGVTGSSSVWTANDAKVNNKLHVLWGGGGGGVTQSQR